jgi:hypothetical protein
MSKYAKLIGALALGTVAVVTFVLIQTAGKSPTKAVTPRAPAVVALGAGDFAGVAPNEVQVTCAPGATTGTADVQLKVVASNAGDSRFEPGNILGPNRRVVVSWEGGEGSSTITRMDRLYGAGGGSTFPCPAQAGQPATTTFSFQLYSGSAPIGQPVNVNAILHRLGSAS